MEFNPLLRVAEFCRPGKPTSQAIFYALLNFLESAVEWINKVWSIYFDINIPNRRTQNSSHRLHHRKLLPFSIFLFTSIFSANAKLEIQDNQLFEIMLRSIVIYDSTQGRITFSALIIRFAAHKSAEQNEENCEISRENHCNLRSFLMKLFLKFDFNAFPIAMHREVSFVHLERGFNDWDFFENRQGKWASKRYFRLRSFMSRWARIWISSSSTSYCSEKAPLCCVPSRDPFVESLSVEFLAESSCSFSHEISSI